MRRHTVVRGDTLGKIARASYGDAGLYTKLAAYNGILTPYTIYIGQVILIPSKMELLGGATPPPPPPHGLTPPHGLDEIRAIFGNIYDYIGTNGEPTPGWESKFITGAVLPYSIPYTYKPGAIITRLRCHVKLKEIIPSVFAEIDRKGLRNKIKTCGGCYNFRTKRGGSSFSTHSWGIAIDLNELTNPMGKPGDMEPRVVEIFESFGFKWGGDWPGRSKDPMHFQFCTGY